MKQNEKQVSLKDLKTMRADGKLFHDAMAPAGETLGPDFWAMAVVETPKKPRSVHLKLDQDVFDFFVKQTGGKGHLTQMQAVLKAYVKAQSRTL
jgi:uncharacterized protein (DUF4415 family)